MSAPIESSSLNEARRIGQPRVFAINYKPGFFEKQEFHIADVMQFPRKVWNECYRCPKFPSCSEIAVAIDLTTPAPAAAVPNEQRVG